MATDSLQTYLNRKAGTTGLSVQNAMNALAGTTGLSTQNAANIYNGSTGLTTQQALNAKVSIALIDSFTDNDTNANVFSGGNTHIGQSFQTVGATTLDSCKFLLASTSTPTGNMVAKVFATTGTYGTNEVPTGAALATSDAVAVSVLTTTPANITFTFSGANRITLNAATTYTVVVNYQNTTTPNGVVFRYKNSGVGHGGSLMTSSNGSSWTRNNLDGVFYIYGSGGTSGTLLSKQDAAALL